MLRFRARLDSFDQNGKFVWQTRIGLGGKLGGVEWGMAAGNGVVFAPLDENGSTAAVRSSRFYTGFVLGREGGDGALLSEVRTISEAS